MTASEKRSALILCIPTLWLCLLLPTTAEAQCNSCITGTVQDQHEQQPLHRAVVSILTANDTVLLHFARTDAHGTYKLPVPPPGKYLVMVTYPGYADYIDHLSVSKDSIVPPLVIPLIKKADLLEEVIVKQKLSAIRVKGDTIEYSADSFHVEKGASVEALLKKLPGIQVDKDGNITAQGQKVNKVLVDGEEFFSDDPAVLIQSLDADYVKDVQVYDKKSEQAEFSGVDDGKRSRTINLKLKQDRKKGYFGKLNAGGGTNGNFDNTVLLNAFKGARKLSVYGIASNTNHAALDWDDRNKLGGDDNVDYDETNGWFTMGGNSTDNEFNADLWSDEGLPTTWNGGLHYGNKWGDAQKVNADYKFMKRNLASESGTTTRYILPDTQYFNSDTRRAFTTRTKHALSGRYDFKFDSTSSLRVLVGGNHMDATTASINNSRALNADSTLVNENGRSMNGNTTRNHLTAEVLWRKRLKKKGRTLTLSFSEDNASTDLDGLLASKTDFYLRDTLARTERIDQQKRNTSYQNEIQGSVTYTEPLTTALSLSIHYNLGITDNTAHRSSYDKDPADGKYNLRDSIYSNDFRYNYNTNGAGMLLNWKGKKLNASAGGSATRSSYLQRDLDVDSVSRYAFTNFFPNANVSYKFNPTKTLVFSYNGRTNPPSPDQIQPVRKNDDPLNIEVGNPNLRQSFVHTVNLYFWSSQVLKGRFFNMGIWGSRTDHPIGSSSVVDSGGKTTRQFVNTKPATSLNIYSGYSMQLNGSKLRFDMSIWYAYSQMQNIVNRFENNTVNHVPNIRLRLSGSLEKKWDYSIGPSFGYSFSRSSIRPDVRTQYFTMDPEASGTYYLPWHFVVSTDISYHFRQKTDAFDLNRNVLAWNARLAKKFAKNDRGEIAVTIDDILNQNLGFERTATTNFVTEHTYSVLRRFAMLRFTYNISKTP